MSKQVGYILLIIFAYGITQYCYIPSFSVPFMGHRIIHIQPEWTYFMKCVSITLLTLSLCLLMALWHYLWIRLIMGLVTWGMFNNAVDELTNQATLFGTSEKLSFLFALLTTIVLIWRKHQLKK